MRTSKQVKADYLTLLVEPGETPIIGLATKNDAGLIFELTDNRLKHIVDALKKRDSVVHNVVITNESK